MGSVRGAANTCGSSNLQIVFTKSQVVQEKFPMFICWFTLELKENDGFFDSCEEGLSVILIDVIDVIDPDIEGLSKKLGWVESWVENWVE